MHVKKVVDFNITCMILAIKGGVLKIPKHTAHRGCDGGFFKLSFTFALLLVSTVKAGWVSLSAGTGEAVWSRPTVSKYLVYCQKLGSIWLSWSSGLS